MTDELVLDGVNVDISDGSQGKFMAEHNHCVPEFGIEVTGYLVVPICATGLVELFIGHLFAHKNVDEATEGSCVMDPKVSCSQLVQILLHQPIMLTI